MPTLRGQLSHLKTQKTLRAVLLVGGAIAIILIAGMTLFDGQSLWFQIRQFSGAALALSLGAVLLQIFCQTARLWFLFPRSARLSWRTAAVAFIRGQFVGNWVSTQAGYAIKIWYLRPRTKRDRKTLSILSATTIVFLDKVVDIAVLALLSVAGALWFLQTQSPSQHSEFTAITNQIVDLRQQIESYPAQSISFIVGLTICAYLLRKLWVTQLRSSPKIKTLNQQLKTSFAFLKSPSQTCGASTMGFGDWIFEMLSLQILCAAQGFHLNFAQLTMCLLILNLGISLPSGIANVGAFEASLTFALIQVGIPLEQSLAIAVIYHALQLAGITIWYLIISLWKTHQPQAESDTRIHHEIKQP